MMFELDMSLLKIGRSYNMLYEMEDGQVTSRTIKLKSVSSKCGENYFYAYCLSKNMNLTFKCSNIREIFDCKTGQSLIV